MPKKALLHGQLPQESMDTFHRFIENKGLDPYRQLVDPISLRNAKIQTKSLKLDPPEFILLVDTAERDWLNIVKRMRLMGYFALGRSLRKPTDSDAVKNQFCGDFAVLQWIGDGETTESDFEYEVPCGYKVLIDIERKTMADLVASFMDGRRERQRKEHAQSSALRHVILYEGSPSELEGRLASFSRQLNSDYDHLVYASPFYVRMIYTHAELLDTLKNAVRYSAQAVLDERHGIRPYLTPSFAGKDNTGALRNMDNPQEALVGILTRVRGVSVQAAHAIIDSEFPSGSPVDFFRAIVEGHDDPEKREKLVEKLSNVNVPTANSYASRSSTRLASRANRIVDLFDPPKRSSDQETSQKKRVRTSVPSSVGDYAMDADWLGGKID